MYILVLCLSIILTIILARLDKRDELKNGISLKAKNKYADWYEYYEGRRGGYMAFVILSFVPYINYALLTVLFIIYLVILFKILITASFWNRLF